jgi:hypothetical protein
LRVSRVLLTKESNTIEHFSRARRGGFEALMQFRIFGFELRDALLGVHITAATFRGDSLQSRLGGLRALSECREFLAQIADERFEFFERFRVRPYGGRHRVLSPAL